MYEYASVLGVRVLGNSLGIIYRNSEGCPLIHHSLLTVILYIREEKDWRKVNMFVQFSSVQSLSCVWLFATPWTAAHQPSLSITNSWGLPKLTSIESVMPCNHLILSRPLLLLPSIFPSIRVFSISQLFTSGGQSTGHRLVAYKQQTFLRLPWWSSG